MKTAAMLLDAVKTQQQIAEHSWAGFSPDQEQILRQKGFQVSRGKVRDLARKDDVLLLAHTDRLSAFDRHVASIPMRGAMLATLSAWWFEQTRDIVPNHFLGLPHPRVIRAKRLRPLMAEVIVRGHLAGSMMRAYEKGVRTFCGEQLPDGLSPWSRLPHAIITPTTKAETYAHDEDTTPDELVRHGVVTRDQWSQVARTALALFERGREICSRAGWILVDTKYEFGLDDAGRLHLIDEIHTPDSSRFWAAASFERRMRDHMEPEMFDKEIIRRWLMDQGFSGNGPAPVVPVERLVQTARQYLDVTERLTGKPLKVDEQENSDRLLDAITGGI